MRLPFQSRRLRSSTGQPRVSPREGAPSLEVTHPWGQSGRASCRPRSVSHSLSFLCTSEWLGAPDPPNAATLAPRV